MLGENKAFIGRITGIPIVIDASLIVLVILFGGSYFRGGSPTLMLQGLCIVCGGLGSILFHELAHAWAGRLVRCEATHIELNGMGGLCYFGRARRNRIEDIFVTLAGPAANLALWALFYGLQAGLTYFVFSQFWDDTTDEIKDAAYATAFYDVQYILSALASLNLGMFVFNLLPSFPLDGGTALAAFLSKRAGGHANAVKTVASLGYIVCALCVYVGLTGNMFMLVVAYSLFMANYQQSAIFGRQSWKRWN